MSSASRIGGDRSRVENKDAIRARWRSWATTLSGIGIIALLIILGITVHDASWWVLAVTVTLWLGYHLSWLMKSLDD